jgi:hypothetical protein
MVGSKTRRSRVYFRLLAGVLELGYADDRSAAVLRVWIAQKIVKHMFVPSEKELKKSLPFGFYSTSIPLRIE